MCGIAGIFGGSLPRAPRRAATEAMLQAIAHRGPDGQGLEAEDGWSLAHCRLAIIAPGEGAQPMWSPDGRYCLAYNGEVYNYVELRQQLETEGVTFATGTDTEVVLQLLIRSGTAGLRRCNGMFALALYDTRTRTLLLARDHCGIKPLYYAPLADGGIAFASEIKALFHCPGCRPEADRESLNAYLVFQFCLGDKTLFKNIFKLPPGHVLLHAEGEGNRTQPWYRQDTSLDIYHNETYFVEALRHHLERSVQRQLRSDVPLGAYLSGGLDSSIVTTLAARHSRNFSCFTGYFTESPAYDETRYAKAVCDATGVNLHAVAPSEQDFVDWMPRIIRAMDEPVAGPGVFPQFLVSRLASRHVKVCLGGQGGDELFGGYARYLVAYLEQALKGAIFETQSEGRFVVTLESIVPNLPVLRQYVPMLRQFWQSGLFESADRRYFALLNRAPHILPLLTPEQQRNLDMEGLFSRFAELFNGAGSMSGINRMLHVDQQTLLPALLQVEDRASMYSGLESRVPLLDPEIMRLAVSIPPTIKFKGGKLKNVLREAVAPFIVPEVLRRKDKMGFPVPLGEWMRRPPVRDFVCDILLSRRSRQRGIYSLQALETLAGTDDNGSRRALWGALCLELWHQTFIDNLSADAC